MELVEFYPDSVGNGNQNRHETYQCPLYSRELLMMGKQVARNM
jgi:hypothetical protein